MEQPYADNPENLLQQLDLHSLFRFAAPTHEIAKLRQSLLVKHLSNPAALYANINELSDFLDDRDYEHSNAALNLILALPSEALLRFVSNNETLAIEIGNYQKYIPGRAVDDGYGSREYVPEHYESTPVYDELTAKELLSGKNRSNLTLLLFKLLFGQHGEAPHIQDFQKICEFLKPKLRTIDYGMLLNYAAQPAKLELSNAEHFPYYLETLKAATVLLHYLMTNQVTNSVRRLHEHFFIQFLETIKEDQALDAAEKKTLLEMINLCYGYTVLTDKELQKKSTSGVFASAPATAKKLLTMISTPLETEFLFAQPDGLNANYLKTETQKVLTHYDKYTASLGDQKKLSAFDAKIQIALVNAYRP